VLDSVAELGQLQSLVVVEVLGGRGGAQPSKLVDHDGVLAGRHAPGELAEQHADPGQDRRVGSPVAAGLGDREIHQVCERRPRQNDARAAVVVVQRPGTELAAGELAQQRRGVSERVDRGRRVVDAGGQRLVSDVG